MDKLPDRLYNFIKRQLETNDKFTACYSELAVVYDVKMRDIYEALNELERDDKLVVEAITSLGNGDYEVRFEVKG